MTLRNLSVFDVQANRLFPVFNYVGTTGLRERVRSDESNMCNGRSSKTACKLVGLWIKSIWVYFPVSTHCIIATRYDIITYLRMHSNAPVLNSLT